MNRLRLLGFALLAVFALSAIASSIAPANPTILPEPTNANPLVFSSEGGKSIFKTATGEFECETVENEGTFITADLGTAHLHFLGCKLPGSSKCKTGTDTNGQILLTADVHLVDLLPSGVLTLGIAFILLENVVLTCGVGKVELAGTVLGSIDGPKTLVKTKTGTVLLNTPGGKQEFVECDLLESFCLTGGVHKKFELLGKFSTEEGFKPLTLKSEDKITLAREVEFHF